MPYCFKLVSVPLVVLQFECEMCLGHKWIVCVASCLGLIQSVIWTGLSIVGALVYLDIIKIQPYRDPADFFRVTLVKVYFEGFPSKIDGSYLGKFEKDYRNQNKLDLLWSDKVFAILVAYIVINVFYFFLSISLVFNGNSKTPHGGKRLLNVALEWSLITLVLCVIDVMLAYFLIRDFIHIQDYVNKLETVQIDNPNSINHIAELPYIPLTLAIISGRMVILWIWNFLIGCVFLFDAICFKTVLGGSVEPEKEQKQKLVVPPKPPQPSQVLPPVERINQSYSNSFDIRNDPDWIDMKRSMEAFTSFSGDCGEAQEDRKSSRVDLDYAPSNYSFKGASTSQRKSQPTEPSAINEGYESDENANVVIEPIPDSNENAQRIKPPPLGKPVSIPIPPSLPAVPAVVESSCC